jgi:exodeoxyribonuclease V alpha subunit
LYSALLKKYDLEEIQILSPQKTGLCGTNYLNFLLQEQLNPDNNEIRFLNKTIGVVINGQSVRFDLYFKKGDRVINTKNNYTIPWYQNVGGKLVIDGEHAGITNGEVGTIVKLIETKTDYNEYNQKIIVRYEDKYIMYENDFSDIEHAYALTIHKSQGSEWKSVILILSNANQLMLDRNLLYTGYTRAKEFIATLTDAYTLEKCIKTEKSMKRNTGLKDRLLEYVGQ